MPIFKRKHLKKTILLVCIVLCGFTSFSQNSFCDGWEKGYQSGMKSISKEVYIIPICPITTLANTFEIGYEMGFNKATGRNVSTIANSELANKDFCKGWEDGYTNAMGKIGKTIFIVPICPIPKLGKESYIDGFIKAYEEAREKNNLIPELDIISTNTDQNKSFCEGWEKGYRFGLQLWANEKDKNTPIKLIPICPIAPINKDTYYHGFEMGKNKALKDME